jgi:tetratricopeptide (TPR) repeat protein
MRRRGLIAVGILMGVTIGAQAHGQSGATASQRSEGPEATSGMGKDANYDTLQAHQRGGISFMGKVVVEDAMFPWDPIPVVVTCNGVVRYRTDADSKGNFTIQGQGSSNPVTDSELAPKPGATQQATASQLIGCDAQAVLTGFKSTTVHIANLNIMDNPDIGTITVRPDTNAAASATSATMTTANPEAMKRFTKARAEFQSNNIGGAEKDLEKAVQIDPKFADAWYQLGKLQQAENKVPDAMSSYQKAVAADPKFVTPYERIAEVAAINKQWQTVTDATGQALKLDPAGTPQIWYLDALGNLNLGKTDVAEASARKSLAMDPQHTAPNTEQLLAVILAGQGEYAEALQHLRNSLTYIKSGPNADLIKQQIAQLEKALPQSGTN